ncbi:hypothetical protein BG004_003782 [Podila humilis]|nr:hypothetical protein BG004_003782 [Podila humilis]
MIPPQKSSASSSHSSKTPYNQRVSASGSLPGVAPSSSASLAYASTSYGSRSTTPSKTNSLGMWSSSSKPVATATAPTPASATLWPPAGNLTASTAAAGILPSSTAPGTSSASSTVSATHTSTSTTAPVKSAFKAINNTRKIGSVRSARPTYYCPRLPASLAPIVLPPTTTASGSANVWPSTTSAISKTTAPVVPTPWNPQSNPPASSTFTTGMTALTMPTNNISNGTQSGTTNSVSAFSHQTNPIAPSASKASTALSASFTMASPLSSAPPHPPSLNTAGHGGTNFVPMSPTTGVFGSGSAAAGSTPVATATIGTMFGLPTKTTSVATTTTPPVASVQIPITSALVVVRSSAATTTAAATTATTAATTATTAATTATTTAAATTATTAATTATTTAAATTATAAATTAPTNASSTAASVPGWIFDWATSKAVVTTSAPTTGPRSGSGAPMQFGGPNAPGTAGAMSSPVRSTGQIDVPVAQRTIKECRSGFTNAPKTWRSANRFNPEFGLLGMTLADDKDSAEDKHPVQVYQSLTFQFQWDDSLEDNEEYSLYMSNDKQLSFFCSIQKHGEEFRLEVFNVRTEMFRRMLWFKSAIIRDKNRTFTVYSDLKLHHPGHRNTNAFSFTTPLLAKDLEKCAGTYDIEIRISNLAMDPIQANPTYHRETLLDKLLEDTSTHDVFFQFQVTQDSSSTLKTEQGYQVKSRMPTTSIDKGKRRHSSNEEIHSFVADLEHSDNLKTVANKNSSINHTRKDAEDSNVDGMNPNNDKSCKANESHNEEIFESSIVDVGAHASVLSQFPAFRILLSFGSFARDTNVKKVIKMTENIQGDKVGVFRILLQFIYLGEIRPRSHPLFVTADALSCESSSDGTYQIPVPTWEDLYLLSERYQITGLSYLAAEKITEHLETKWAIPFLFRTGYKFPKLRKAVSKFIVENCMEMLLQDAVKKKYLNHEECSALFAEMMAEMWKRTSSSPSSSFTAGTSSTSSSLSAGIGSTLSSSMAGMTITKGTAQPNLFMSHSSGTGAATSAAGTTTSSSSMFSSTFTAPSAFNPPKVSFGNTSFGITSPTVSSPK